ncbi:hypothetical protein ACMFMF_009062 [Clarireedia jacksonii]
MSPPSDFIWHRETGLWESSRMSRAIAKKTEHYIGQRITLRNWRHITIAISKKLAREQGVARADFADADKADYTEHYKTPKDLAASYTSRTAANYWLDKLAPAPAPSSPLSLTRKRPADDDKRERTPAKRPKVLPPERPDLDAGQDQFILKRFALCCRTIMRSSAHLSRKRWYGLQQLSRLRW